MQSALGVATSWQGRDIGRRSAAPFPWPFSSLDINLDAGQSTHALTTSALGWLVTNDGWYNASGTTIMVECTTDGTDTGEKALFQLLGGSAAFLAFIQTAGAGSVRLFSGATYFPFNTPSNHNRYGRQRFIFTLSSASQVTLSGFNPSGPTSGTAAAPADITGMSIGYRGDTNAAGFQNGTGQHIHRVVAWPFVMNEQQIRETMARSNHRNVCIIADSIGGNSGIVSVRNLLLQKLYARGVGYFECRLDARGGGGFTNNSGVYPIEETHVNRYLNSHTAFKRHALITLDSINAEDRTTAPTGINAMRAAFRGHDDFIVTGMWPNGTFLLAEQQAAQALLASSFGNKYANVLPEAQSRADGSPEDAQDVLAGLAPRSLREDSIHQRHPEGDDCIADVLVNKIVSLGLA
jgi:hypothetical protein